MTIDFWGLGLQAINVLILIWLLSRVLWRPVAAGIAKRQDTVKAMIEAAQATQAKADAALAEATEARTGIADERAKTLAAARAEAETATKATLTEARTKAETILAAARVRIDAETKAAHKANDRHASDMSLAIAAKLLERLDGPAARSAFLGQLVDAIAKMPETDRAALRDDPKGIEIVSATNAGTGTGTGMATGTGADVGPDQNAITDAVQSAFGGPIAIRFVTDPALIAGLELRSPHFVLRNSWQADLKQLRKAVQDAS